MDMIHFARYASNTNIPLSSAKGMLTSWFDGPTGDRGHTIWTNDQP